ncbi:hypothetical protein OZ664_08925 [Elizabethkingia sp. HX WHF]|uniref:hypothetical protein n=1 Tax=Elizabethkingia TaxID=308865 RepID=UPI002012017C|nr:MULTISPECIES: hypothetical protein [Elizabethkingia]MCL1636795.1 hypothetical protein [Elizabethkingia bruuniana]MDX8564121.1 hypothetical protein [Elizabethkingia sp. HX WHF]
MMTINRTGSENKDFQDLIHKLDMNLAGKDNLEQWTKEWSCNKCILETGNKMFEVIALISQKQVQANQHIKHKWKTKKSTPL